MVNIPPVGSICLVSFPKKFPNHSFKMEILDTNVKDDSFGTIQYNLIEKYEKRTITRNKTKPRESDIRKWEYVKDERGYIVEETIEHVETTKVNSLSVVEELWFDEELTGRKVEICKN